MELALEVKFYMVSCKGREAGICIGLLQKGVQPGISAYLKPIPVWLCDFLQETKQLEETLLNQRNRQEQVEYIEITVWQGHAVGFYSRVGKYIKRTASEEGILRYGFSVSASYRTVLYHMQHAFGWTTWNRYLLTKRWPGFRAHVLHPTQETSRTWQCDAIQSACICWIALLCYTTGLERSPAGENEAERSDNAATTGGASSLPSPYSPVPLLSNLRFSRSHLKSLSLTPHPLPPPPFLFPLPLHPTSYSPLLWSCDGPLSSRVFFLRPCHPLPQFSATSLVSWSSFHLRSQSFLLPSALLLLPLSAFFSSSNLHPFSLLFLFATLISPSYFCFPLLSRSGYNNALCPLTLRDCSVVDSYLKSPACSQWTTSKAKMNVACVDLALPDQIKSTAKTIQSPF